jgi:hypothetical protein
MSVQVVLSAVERRIMVKFLINENVISTVILMRFRAQFGDETLSITQVCDWSKSNRGSKHAITTPSVRKFVASVSWYSEAAYHSMLLTERVKSAFRSKRRVRTVKSVCILHDNARPHTATVITVTSEEMQWEVLPHLAYSSNLAPGDFHPFDPIKEALGWIMSIAEDKVR